VTADRPVAVQRGGEAGRGDGASSSWCALELGDQRAHVGEAVSGSRLEPAGDDAAQPGRAVREVGLRSQAAGRRRFDSE